MNPTAIVVYGCMRLDLGAAPPGMLPIACAAGVCVEPVVDHLTTFLKLVRPRVSAVIEAASVRSISTSFVCATAPCRHGAPLLADPDARLKPVCEILRLTGVSAIVAPGTAGLHILTSASGMTRWEGSATRSTDQEPIVDAHFRRLLEAILPWSEYEGPEPK